MSNETKYNSNGNYSSDGNYYSNGNYYSDGNYSSNGNYYSNGNYSSNGNCSSNGNYYSNGNYSSNGNCSSNGNYSSDGNYYSDGNYSSNGNYYSWFLKKCKGTYGSIFCFDKKGIANQIFNVEYSEEFVNIFKSKVKEILDGFLPYGTDFKEKKAKGWLKSINNYIRENYVMTNTQVNGEEDYIAGWNKLENSKKEALVNLIKTSDLKNTEEALQIFTEITGIQIENNDTKKQEIINKAKELQQKADELLEQANKL
jgi:hypothetical protein